MPLHPFAQPRGTFETFAIDSKALANNLLGDPTERAVTVYLPEGYGESGDDYPLFVDLVGFTGSGFSHTGWKAYWENVPQRLDRLVADGAMGPVVCAFPDCFTSLGGNQYINSAAMGDWADFLIDEMIPAIEQRFRVRRGREHRAVFGKSSGGYGAIVHGLRYADAWNAIACHSGDMAFEWVYMRDFPVALDKLAKYDGIEGFLKHFGDARKVSGDDFHVLMTLAMAATYDPDPNGPKGIRLPVDMRTCRLDDALWANWMQHDPLVILEDPACQDNLRKLAAVFIDCGSRDQYFLHYGARRFSDRCTALGIAHTYEEFDDNHSGVDYRMDVSLPALYKAVTA